MATVGVKGLTTSSCVIDGGLDFSTLGQPPPPDRGKCLGNMSYTRNDDVWCCVERRMVGIGHMSDISMCETCIIRSNQRTSDVWPVQYMDEASISVSSARPCLAIQTSSVYS